MISTGSVYSADAQRSLQRRLNLVILFGLLVGSMGLSLVLLTGRSPKLAAMVLILCLGFVGAGILWREPVKAVYALVFCALFIEQWPIIGLSPLTTRVPLYTTLQSQGIPLPVSIVELVLLMALVRVALPGIRQGGRALFKSELSVPLRVFLLAVVAAFLHGWLTGDPRTDFWLNAAWAESRSLIYLIASYFLAVNLISDPSRLIRLIWVIIGALGLKGVQGLWNWYTERRMGLSLPALTGHEDVVFFATFFILLAGMQLFVSEQRAQRNVMLWFLLPLSFTMLATGRRLAFIVLAVGFITLGASLYRTNRALFFRLAPLVLILLSLYTAAFWNRGGSMLGEPVRAFRSQFGEASERDKASDLWRDLENLNTSKNIARHPIIGLGFGRPYKFYIEIPTLDTTGFVYWKHITHNAIYWVWMKMGLHGFIAFWYLIGASIVQGLIIFRQVTSGYHKAIALTVVSLVIMQVFFAYGDLGLTYSRPMIYLGAMLGVLARLPHIDREYATELLRIRHNLEILTWSQKKASPV